MKIHDDQDEVRTCRAFDYNIRTGSCRFFERNSQDDNARTIDSTRAHAYEFDEACWAKHNAPTAPPHLSACKTGSKPLMERVSGAYLKASGLAFKQMQEKECVKACLKDTVRAILFFGALSDDLRPLQMPNRNEDYKCLSVSYNDENQACVYLNQIARPLNKNGPPLTPDARYRYYAKMCLSTDAVAKCPGYITRFVGKQLVAMSDAKTTTSDYSECVRACLTAETKLGFVCRSGMFYNKVSVVDSAVFVKATVSCFAANER